MKDLILQFFQAKAFPELAAAIRARIDSIIQRWEVLVKESLPNADQLTHKQLRNALPDTLEKLATALETTGVQATREFVAESKEHGIDRFDHDYSLLDLLIEFDLLRPLMMEEAAFHLKRDITLGEVIALNMGVDLAARRSVVAFVRYQRQELEVAAGAQAKYLSFMSHDIRGGLNAILLSAEVLHQDLKGDSKFVEALEDVEMIRRNILDTVGTMDRFLRAEQLRSGKVVAKHVPLNLRELVDSVISGARHTAAAKGLDLVVEIEENCQIETDRELVLTVLQNLVANAIKYTQSGQVKIAMAKADSACSMVVSDTGPGIPPDRLEQMFMPFVRGETHGQGGVGLGLYIARQAADVLRATLSAQSKVGEGTTFTLNIPA